MKPEKSFVIRKNYTKPQEVLESFSLQLDSHLNQIKNLQIKKKKKPEISLPSIKQTGKSVYARENLKPIQVEHKANQLEVRINKIERSNQSFMGLRNYKNLFRSEHESPRYPPQQMMMPIQYIPYPIINFYPNPWGDSSNYRNNQFNSNQNTNQGNSDLPEKKNIEDEDKKSKISLSRKNYLKRRLKVISIAIYFIFVYKTYFETIVYRRFQNFLELQERVSTAYDEIEAEVYDKLISFNIFEKFYFLTREIEANSVSEKNISVVFEEEDVKINIEACQQFVSQLLNQVHQSIKSGALSSLNPIFSNFLQSGFLYTSFFLQEELKILSIHKDYGYLIASPEISKMLLINFVFVRVIIYQLVGKKELLSILYNFYKKKPQEKKYTLFYGKKLTITLILLYEAINGVFFLQSRKLTPNYETLPQYAQVKPINELQYQFSLNNKQNSGKKKSLQKGLIKNIACPQNIKRLFLNGFESNWMKIKRISQSLYQDAESYKFDLLREIKRQIYQNPFPERKLLKDILRIKNQKIRDFEAQSSNSYEEDEQNEGEGSQLEMTSKTVDKKQKKKLKKGIKK